jgi:hypothetical protein
MSTIVCSCDAKFEADIPESIDIDAAPDQKLAILNGSFMVFTCPTCGRALKPEYQLAVSWPSKAASYIVIPELERPRAAEVEAAAGTEVLAGYAELADRLSVMAAGLDPVSVEALKYYLLLKASEADPDAEPTAWFHGIVEGSLEFHIHGLRPNEVAVSRVPRSVYERTLSEKRGHPESEPFCLLRKGAYISVQNLFNAAEA